MMMRAATAVSLLTAALRPAAAQTALDLFQQALALENSGCSMNYGRSAVNPNGHRRRLQLGLGQLTSAACDIATLQDRAAEVDLACCPNDSCNGAQPSQCDYRCAAHFLPFNADWYEHAQPNAHHNLICRDETFSERFRRCVQRNDSHRHRAGYDPRGGLVHTAEHQPHRQNRAEGHLPQRHPQLQSRPEGRGRDRMRRRDHRRRVLRFSIEMAAVSIENSTEKWLFQ